MTWMRKVPLTLTFTPQQKQYIQFQIACVLKWSEFWLSFQPLYTSNFHQQKHISGYFLQSAAPAPHGNHVGKMVGIIGCVFFYVKHFIVICLYGFPKERRLPILSNILKYIFHSTVYKLGFFMMLYSKCFHISNRWKRRYLIGKRYKTESKLFVTMIS